MAFEVDIRTNFLAIDAALEEMKRTHIVQAARRAINRSIVTVRKESISLLQERIKLKHGEIRSRIKTFNARGSKLSNLEGKLLYSGVPISLLTFVRGSKEIIQQKGIPISKRRKLRVEITPGKRFIAKGAFIQKKLSKQVFKRDRQGGFKKQGTPSLGHLLREKGIGKALAKLGGQRFSAIFLDEVYKRLNGIVKSAPLRNVR